MAVQDVLGAVCDRLVGGMMFHSDHADLCRFLGVEWLARLHDDGFLHDSKAHCKVKMMAVRLTDMMVSSGRQERTHALDQWRGMRTTDVTCDKRNQGIADAMDDWCEWEESAASTYRTAYSRLVSMGQMVLADEMRRLAKDTERELAEAKSLRLEMRACGYDIAHVMEMGAEISVTS